MQLGTIVQGCTCFSANGLLSATAPTPGYARCIECLSLGYVYAYDVKRRGVLSAAVTYLV